MYELPSFQVLFYVHCIEAPLHLQEGISRWDQSRFTIPCFTISAKARVVKVFVMEAISNKVFSLTGILLAFEILPKLNTLVPFGSINPTTIAALYLLSI